MWKWIKVPKIGALAAFFMPWLTVSCSGTPLATATGWQLAFGSYSSQAVGVPLPTAGPHMNLWLALAMLVIIAGIWAACISESKQSCLKVMATSAAALILIWLGTGRYSQSALMAEASNGNSGGFSGTIDRAALMMIQFTWDIGFWIAVTGLMAAGIMAFLTYSSDGAMLQSQKRNLASR
jgi:hypothetical protein